MSAASDSLVRAEKHQELPGMSGNANPHHV
jgi:hypothetical protein